MRRMLPSAATFALAVAVTKGGWLCVVCHRRMLLAAHCRPSSSTGEIRQPSSSMAVAATSGRLCCGGTRHRLFGHDPSNPNPVVCSSNDSSGWQHSLLHLLPSSSLHVLAGDNSAGKAVVAAARHRHVPCNLTSALCSRPCTRRPLLECWSSGSDVCLGLTPSGPYISHWTMPKYIFMLCEWVKKITLHIYKECEWRKRFFPFSKISLPPCARKKEL